MNLLQELLDRRQYPEGYKIETLYCEDLSLADLETFLEKTYAEKLFKIIIVCENCLVSAKKINFYRTLCDIDIFVADHLRILLKGNRLVPPHDKLSTDDKTHVLSTYREEDLPQISSNDPISKLYDFKVGDVIKISRPNGIYFRIVVKD